MVVNIKPFNQPYLYNYKYDQLNRLTGMDTYTGLDTVNNNWTALTATKAYNERVSYDGNGNIKKYNRYYNNVSTIMDSLTYNYAAGTNQLGYVQDQSYGYINGNAKIKNQVANNYAYDEIGNLIKDSSEYIPTGGIKWNVYGKISEINHSQAGALFTAKKINYYYDAAGNRIGKKVIKFGSANVSYTWYVRDAQGNVMQVYTAVKDTVAADTTLSPFYLKWAESHIYGSSRLAVLNQNLTAEPPNPQGGVYYNTRGAKLYEISNHLGNILAVISDKKLGHTTSGTTLDYYNNDPVKVTDYYPFGMVSRSAYIGSLSLGYRYSFNGKENDADVKGDGNQIDYGMRVYDPRLGRFLSVDPLTKGYPELTPYQYASNTPIQATDIDGLEGWSLAGVRSQQLKYVEMRMAHLQPSNSNGIQGSNHSNQQKVHNIAVPNTDHAGDNVAKERGNLSIQVADYNKPENQIKRAQQNYTPSTVGAIPPPGPANEFEAGAVKGVQMASVGYAASVCPGCFVAYGGTQVYSGIKNDDAGQLLSGGVNMTVGLLGMSGSGATETFYRSMSTEDFAVLQKTGKIPATAETFISPTAAYSAKYQGVLVEINTKAGTFNELKSMGVRDLTHPMTQGMGLPKVSSGWTLTNAFFKQEAGQINIGLGQGKALEKFNSNIINYREIKNP